ncbi:MAG: lytic transglycosylase domain-containing protein [Bryobacteraceae bacterium]
MRLFGLILILTAGGICRAGETAVLASGARLHVDRHELQEGKIRLFNGSGYIEMDASQVTAFEADESLPAMLAAAPPAVTSQPGTVPAAAQPATPGDLADAAADKYGLPRKLVRSVMRVESGFQPAALSPKGALGLMQLMPETARQLGADPQDPVQNVDAGARYLRQLLEKYDGALWHALAAYNAGAGAVEKYHGIPPYNETIDYVNRVDRELKK